MKIQITFNKNQDVGLADKIHSLLKDYPLNSLGPDVETIKIVLTEASFIIIQFTVDYLWQIEGSQIKIHNTLFSQRKTHVNKIKNRLLGKYQQSFTSIKKVGKLNSLLSHFEDVRAEFNEMEDPTGRVHDLRAMFQFLIATISMLKARLYAVKKLQRQSHQMMKQAGKQVQTAMGIWDDPLFRIGCLNYLGFIYESLGRHEVATKLRKEANQIFAAHGGNLENLKKMSLGLGVPSLFFALDDE